VGGAELVTHPRGIEFSQQEEDVLLARFEGLVLTAAVAVVRPHREAGGQLPEAGGDVGLLLVQLSELAAGAALRGHLPQQLMDVNGH